MRTCKRLFYFVFLLITLFTATSCIEGGGNYQNISGMTGSIVTSNFTKCLRLDNQSTLYYADEFQNYNNNDRLLVSFKIDYDKQTSSSYYIISDVVAQKFPLKSVYDITEAAADTFNTDPIYEISSNFLCYQGNNILLTVNPFFYASNSYHSFNLVRNQLASNVVNNDTLKLEFRHNKKGDANSSSLGAALISYDLTPYLANVSTGTTKVIQVKYNLTSGNKNAYFTYTPSSY